MTKDEALNLALEALKQIDEAMPFPVAKLAQKAIREALAQPEQIPISAYSNTHQPEQEPVAWLNPYGGVIQKRITGHERNNFTIPLYTTPLQRKPLTDEEIHKASTQAGMQEHYMGFHSGFIRFARAIEAAHGIKGEA